MMEAILDIRSKQQVRNQQFFNEIQYSQDLNHNIRDALYQMLSEIQNQQIYYTMNYIVILLAEGQDLSNKGYDQLIPMIRNLRVKVIIGLYSTIGETNDSLQQLAHLVNALPEKVIIVQDLTYQEASKHFYYYEDNSVNTLFAISNLTSMKGHIYQVTNLFSQLLPTFVIRKIYFINSFLQDSGYYENFITQGERENLMQQSRKRQKLMFLVFVVVSLIMFFVFLILVKTM